VLQVDQTGHPSGRRRRSCPKKARLVQAEGRHSLQTSSVVHQRVPWSPPPASRSPSQRRGHERPWPPRGRPCRPADRPERGLVGSAPPWDGSGPPAGPGAYPGGWLTTAPDPLAPGSTTGQPPTGQVAHPDRAPAVELSPRPSAPEVDRVGRGLDGEPPLAACDHRRRGPQAVQAEQPGGRCTPLLTHLGHLSSDVRHPQDRRDPRCCSGGSSIWQQHTPPTPHDESRSICERVPGVNVESGVCELLGC
jgi:hypothetical protein